MDTTDTLTLFTQPNMVGYDNNKLDPTSSHYCPSEYEDYLNSVTSTHRIADVTAAYAA